VSVLLERMLGSEAIKEILEHEALMSAWDEHKSGAADHGEFLWGVMNLGLWREVWRC
jgi:hypothetical protein